MASILIQGLKAKFCSRFPTLRHCPRSQMGALTRNAERSLKGGIRGRQKEKRGRGWKEWPGVKGKEKVVVVGVEEKRGRKEKVPREIGGWKRRKQFSNPSPSLVFSSCSFFFLLRPVHRIIPEIWKWSHYIDLLCRLSLDSSLASNNIIILFFKKISFLVERWFPMINDSLLKLDFFMERKRNTATKITSNTINTIIFLCKKKSLTLSKKHCK